MVLVALILSLISFSGCQMGYILKSAKNQLSMMSDRVSIEEALVNDQLSNEQKRKLKLSQQARLFAFEKLLLKKTENYNSFIDLKRPYVTWIVHAAYPWEMKNYEWSYPFIGSLPYKGFFSNEEAQEYAKEIEQQDLDVYVRGVSAYSTLGWLTDSVLSSMLRYKDHDLVNTIIHEIVHTTVFIKNNADFNEQLAVFIGNKGTELFYLDREGADSATLKLIQQENEDDQLFSTFIKKQIEDIELWYKQNSKNKSLKEAQMNKILQNFKEQLKPHLKTNSYAKFTEEKMNNARLGLYKTYMQNLDEFEKAYQRYDKDLLRFIEAAKSLEKSKNPAEDLKQLGVK